MRKIKIGYFADGIWGHNAFKKIQNDEHIEIKFICPRYNTTDTVLKEFAKQYSIDYLLAKDVNSPEFIKLIGQYDCDLLVSMSFNQIFKHEILQKCKIINCHAGKLPFYRGRNILNWALINGEKEFGITVHFVDEGIDTGDIILQKTFPISDNDDYSTLLTTAHTECPNILHEALISYVANDFKLIKQSEIHPVGMYCGIRGEGDEILNWNMTTKEIYNFIRAICRPGPMATCTLNNRIFRINKAEIIPCAPIYKGNPGQILYKKNDDIVIKTQDSIIKVTEFFYNGKVKIGDRLRSV